MIDHHRGDGFVCRSGLNLVEIFFQTPSLVVQ